MVVIGNFFAYVFYVIFERHSEGPGARYGTILGSFGGPIGPPFGNKPLLGAENLEPFSVSGSRVPQSLLFDRFWGQKNVQNRGRKSSHFRRCF